MGIVNLRGAALAVAALLSSTNAAAFCRTTTCDADASQQACGVDANGCSTLGRPLSWPTECLSYGVQKDGSPKRRISMATLDNLVQLAFKQWAGVDCGGGSHPSIRIWNFNTAYGPILCDQPEYNDEAPNADVWMFRDAAWPYDGQNSTLALTTITFEVESGRILDADVELNSYAIELTTGDEHVHADVQSIVTHEAGHFLGIAHTREYGATMYATYSAGNMGFRTLSPDDKKAVCAAYPPDRAGAECRQPEPPHGFSRYCQSHVEPPIEGCGVARAERAPGPRSALAVVLAAAFIRRWRRRHASRT